MALSDGSVGGQFQSFCYTDPNDRQFIKTAVELAARHFDEIIQDDFFFVTTKYDSDITAKGNRTWSQFRIDLMDEAAKNLLLEPARAINPDVKMVIKYPNWYEHFQGLGFDLEKQPQMFDGIYTGTETRDPETTDQNLQQYESYQIFRYFENIAPGRNGGGWVDTFSIRYIDRYVEQLWDTLFAKAPETHIVRMVRHGPPGSPRRSRMVGKILPTNFNADDMTQTIPPKKSGDAPSEVDLCRRRPPTHSNRSNPSSANSANPSASKVLQALSIPGARTSCTITLGNIGIPIDLYPEFPADADTVLLTASSAHDAAIVEKIKRAVHRRKKCRHHLRPACMPCRAKASKTSSSSAIPTARSLADEYLSGYGPGSGAALTEEQNPADHLFPDIRFLTNDSWPIIRAHWPTDAAIR